jgi:hypothetical protein
MFDLSKFQKTAEDKDTTTLKHEDGHEMRIMHAMIPKIQREQLKRLKMSEGGEAQEADLKRKERAERRDAPMKPNGNY